MNDDEPPLPGFEPPADEVDVPLPLGDATEEARP